MNRLKHVLQIRPTLRATVTTNWLKLAKITVVRDHMMST